MNDYLPENGFNAISKVDLLSLELPRISLDREMKPDNRPLPFFPHPAVGETIYSLFCRSIARSGLPATTLLMELTGQRRKASLLSALPGHLSLLSSKLPSGHPWCDASEIATAHTGLPYFTYFDSPEDRNNWAKKLAHAKSSAPLAMSLGLSSFRCGAAALHPRYCHLCSADDRRNYGFTYFRREHQLPGVVVCANHAVPLAHGCIHCGSYPIKSRAFCMPGKCLCTNEATPLNAYKELPEETEPLMWIANQTAFMVDSAGTRHRNIRANLRDRALARGMGKGSVLVQRELENRFV